MKMQNCNSNIQFEGAKVANILIALKKEAMNVY